MDAVDMVNERLSAWRHSVELSFFYGYNTRDPESFLAEGGANAEVESRDRP